jgi:hypothetical protein
MKIKRKELLSWVSDQLTIRYRGELYKAHYNGRYYFLSPVLGGELIPFYEKEKGVFGLTTNKK